MNTNSRPSTPPGDDLDRLLTAYFRAEMPARWPPAPAPAGSGGSRRPARPDNADPAVRSRWALAASVALLVGSCWYLSGLATDGRPKKGPGLDDTTAKMPKEVKDHLGGPKAKTP